MPLGQWCETSVWWTAARLEGSFCGKRSTLISVGSLGNEAEGTLVVFQTVNVSIRMLLEQHWKSSLELCSHLHNNHHQDSDTYDSLQRYLFFFKKDFFRGGASVWSKWPRRGAMLSYDGNRLLHWWKIYPTPKRKFEVFHSK